MSLDPMKKFLQSLLLSTILISSISIDAQDIANSELLKALTAEGEDQTSGGISEDKGYRSFVQNEFSSIFNKLNDLNERDMQNVTLADLNEKRLKLATDLCTKDSRACFLIEEYRDYEKLLPAPESFQDLELFGSDIFSGYANEFNFYDSLPVSGEYKLKIGDELNIYLYGGLDMNEPIQINNQGTIIVEGIGSIMLAGLTFDEATEKIQAIVNQNFIGTQLVLSLKQIRSKQVFILGNIRSPGTFVLNAFSTPLNALISAGGIKANSSLRNVKLLRGGKEYASLDFYDLLINGNSSNLDLVLNDGDTMLLGGLANSISILGEVIRPAIYEFKEGETIEQALSFALGVTPFADLTNISVIRNLPTGQRTILNPVNLSAFVLENGDEIRVNPSNGQTINYVSIEGTIRNPRQFSYRDGLKLGNLIQVSSDLLGNTYTGFAVIKRLNFNSRSSSYLGFSATDQSTVNSIDLRSGDKVYFFSKNDIKFLQSRTIASFFSEKLKNLYGTKTVQNNLAVAAQLKGIEIPMSVNKSMKSLNVANVCMLSLDTLMDSNVVKAMDAKLKVFSSNADLACPDIFNTNPDLLPILLVTSIPVTGNIRFPGIYPIAKDTNALDLFYIAGGFLFPNYDEIPLFEVGQRPGTFSNISSNELESSTNLIFFKPHLRNSATNQGYVKLVGEFVNPGMYLISKGMKLSDIYKRAGGLTVNAFPLGGILSRTSVKDAEVKALARAKAELSEILASAVASGYLKQNSTDLIGLVSLMTEISDAEPVGRLVAELNPNTVARNPSSDLLLEGGDEIYIPSIQSTVTVVGQVLNPITVPYSERLRSNDYIGFAGGYKKEADKKRMYIILPNGKSAPVSISFLERGPFSKNDILPGSSIIVPRKARPMDSLALVETVSPIIASLSVTAASIAAISNNN